MDPPKSKTTIRISTNMGTASHYADSPMTVVELKGRKPEEKGQHYLQLSLGALKELAGLLEDSRLSGSEKVAYGNAYDSSMARYDDMVRLRDRLLTQKKSFRRFLVNLFVRESEASRFYKISYRNYSAIRQRRELRKRFTDDCCQLGVLLLVCVIGKGVNFIDAIDSAAGSLEGRNVSVCEESPRDVVEGNVLVKDLPPNETLRGINLVVHTEQEENEAVGILNRIAAFSGEEEEEDEDDDDRTIRPSISQSSLRPPSPSPSCTVIYNFNNINNSVISLNSEVTGATINTGVNEGTV